MENKSTKVYKTAPLPFQGQKRNFVEQFKVALKDFKENHGVDTVVDLFGGSGLLSHTAKRMYPEMRVVYNDFDDFHLRLRNIDVTNGIINAVRGLLKDFPKEVKLTPDLKEKALHIVKEAEQKGLFVDYITLSSSLTFSGKFAVDFKGLASNGLYNNVKQSDYVVDCYLDGLEIVKLDYKRLYEQFKDNKNVLMVADPPYLSTDTKTYSSDKYWKLKDYLDVLKVIQENHYIFFTSNKSSLIELFEWLEVNYMLRNPFSNAFVNRFNARVSHSGKYTDLMYYKNYKRK